MVATTVIVLGLALLVTMGVSSLVLLVVKSASVQNSAVELLNGLADRLDEIAKAPSAAAIRALSAEIHRHAEELGTAIARHAEDETEEPGPEDPEVATRRR